MALKIMHCRQIRTTQPARQLYFLHCFLLADAKPSTCAFSIANGGPSFTDTVTFFSRMPWALRISKLFAAEIWTFSKTTFDIMLSGRPVMMPATWGQVAFRLLMRMLRKTGVLPLMAGVELVPAPAGRVVSPAE